MRILPMRQAPWPPIALHGRRLGLYFLFLVSRVSLLAQSRDAARMASDNVSRPKIEGDPIFRTESLFEQAC